MTRHGEEHRIKRVPVIRDGKLVGIVSCANLLHSWRRAPTPAPPERWTNDRSIRDEVARVLDREGLTTHRPLNMTVTNGVVELRGLMESEEERLAMRTPRERPWRSVVRNNLGSVPPWLWGVSRPMPARSGSYTPRRGVLILPPPGSLGRPPSAA